MPHPWIAGHHRASVRGDGGGGVVRRLPMGAAPRTWIEIAILMHRYPHLSSNRPSAWWGQKKTRLGYGRWQSFRSMGNLAGMVMLRSLDQAERSHEAMVARGYQGFLPLPCLPPLPRRQVALGFVAVTILAATYLLAQRWPP